MADKDSSIEANLDEIEVENIDEQSEGSMMISDESDKPDGRHPLLHKFSRFAKSGGGKALIGFVLIAGTLLAVPMTRYAMLGFVIKKTAIITVVDDTTGKPVTNATVHFARADGTTDSKGVVKLDAMSVGDHPLSVEKKYYQAASTSYTVPIFTEAKTVVRLRATGRLAAITVKNSISGKLLSGASVKVSDTVAVTDDNGIANIALAINNSDQPGTVSLAGYTDGTLSISTKDLNPTADISLVPAGKVYFLSNRNGTYDIMSSTVDGAAQAIVLKGTGKELPYELELEPSPSGKYAAYRARRDGGDQPQLYMVDLSTQAVTTVDNSGGEGIIGWADDTLYYQVSSYQANIGTTTKLVMYNAATQQNTVLDTSKLEGDQYNFALQGIATRGQLFGGRLYYAKCWTYSVGYSGATNRPASLVVITGGKVVNLKDVPQSGSAYCDELSPKPDTTYFKLTSAADYHTSQSYRYLLGKSVESVQVPDSQYDDMKFYKFSPNGQKTFWGETRDGKQVTFQGNSNADNAVKTSTDTYEVTGWFGDDYVLYNKGGSELYIAPAGAQFGGEHKITDYYSQHGPGI